MAKTRKNATERDLKMLKALAEDPYPVPANASLQAVARTTLALVDATWPAQVMEADPDKDSPGRGYYQEQFFLRDVGHGTSVRFMDDMARMFVSEDCGGDLNFILFASGAGPTAPASGFASLEPAEVVRLHKMLGERIATYPDEIREQD